MISEGKHKQNDIESLAKIHKLSGGKKNSSSDVAVTFLVYIIYHSKYVLKVY